MFEEAIKSLKSVLHPQKTYEVVQGRTYMVTPGEHGASLGGLVAPPSAATLVLVSLTGFIDAFKAKIDDFGEAIVQVVDHERVVLLALRADEYGRRHTWLHAKSLEQNPFPFGQYQVPEAFLLSLQGGFLPTEAVIQLQQFASALSSESSISTQDDGFTQVVTVKQGAVTRGTSEIPKRIKLMPYRTFREIDPVESEFIVRLRGKQGELPTIALIEVDAGRWKHDTALMVKRYLAKHLPEGTVIVA
jgi:hypothetical protein